MHNWTFKFNSECSALIALPLFSYIFLLFLSQEMSNTAFGAQCTRQKHNQIISDILKRKQLYGSFQTGGRNNILFLLLFWTALLKCGWRLQRLVGVRKCQIWAALLSCLHLPTRFIRFTQGTALTMKTTNLGSIAPLFLNPKEGERLLQIKQNCCPI